MTAVLRRVMVTVSLAMVVSWVVAIPASAATGANRTLTPLAGEWWFTTWKILPKVWPITQGAGVTVALLDSGVQADVPDLRGVVVPGGDMTGRHTNGETDFNTVGDGHGTSMAVLIAGQGDGTGMVGVAPKSKILPVAVNSSSVDMTADPGRIAAGIIYAANHGAQVIDISQVYPSASASACDPEEQAAVAYAISRNIVVVAAEGSSNLIGGRPSEPASCAGVMSVGAIQHNRTLWPDDVQEPYLTVTAPGAGLISSGRDGKLVTNVSGARAASALVAGVAALIRSRYPAMPWNQVIQRIIGTALPEGGQVPNESFGFGIVRMSEVANATAFPVPVSTPNPVYSKFLAWKATAQGQSVERQIAAHHAAAAPKHTSHTLMASMVVGVVLLLAAIAVILAAIVNRRPRRPVRRVRDVAAPAPPAPPVRVPVPEAPARSGRYPNVLVEDDPDAMDAGPYRVPPYSPIPEPRTAPLSRPLASDGEFFFPDGGTPRAK